MRLLFGVVEAVGSSPVTQTISNPRIYAVCKELWTALILFKIATTTLTTTIVTKKQSKAYTIKRLYKKLIAILYTDLILTWNDQQGYQNQRWLYGWWHNFKVTFQMWPLSFCQIRNRKSEKLKSPLELNKSSGDF